MPAGSAGGVGHARLGPGRVTGLSVIFYPFLIATILILDPAFPVEHHTGNPGPKVSEAIGGYNPSADHDMHFHLRLNDGREIRYLADTFEVHPYDKNKDTREHDKIIQRLSPEERAHITKATHEMIETGKLSPESKARARGQFSKEARKAAKRIRPPE